jgi:small-conductance mechanosensitive channel
LEGINAGSLMFCLRVFLIDQADAVEIRSRLLISSLRALRSEGIEIPRDQRDIHLRDLDGLKQLARAMLAERRKALNPQANALDPKGES